ncbi:flippase [Lactobacillus crispatus]|uniref:flippase n=1 Tax=Lactobacillus crispatus TaxID=47770 RepID=UPI0015DF7228|nr:flippase [Lactobacillus crispatus]QLK32456.1 flippase [Lactobacillus crispatus]
MKKKSLGFNALLNGLRSALNLIFPLITFPYVSRVLSVEGMGIYNFSSTYVGYFVLLAGLGIVTYAVREGAKYRDDVDKMNIFASQVFTINMISTFISYILLILSLIIFKSLRSYVLTILIFSLQIFFTTIGTEWIYTIYEDYQYITIRSIIFKFISIFFLFIFVKNSTDYLWYAGITVFASVGSNLLNYLHAKSIVQIKLVKNPNWRYHLKPILIIFASTLAMTLYISSDTTILGLLKNNYDVGIYSVSVKIYTIINGLINGLLVVTIPRFAMLLGRRKITEYKRVLSTVINNASILVLPTTVGLIMLSREIVLVIAGNKYLDSVFPLQIISFAIIFANFALIFNECILIPAKREKKTLRNTIITGLINIILNVLLIPLWSYNSAALTTVIAEGMMMIMSAWDAKDILRDIIFSKGIIKNVFSAIAGCIGIVMVCLLCNLICDFLIGKIVLSVFLSILVYGGILLLLKNEVIESWIKKLKN